MNTPAALLSARTTPDAGEGFETAVELAVCRRVSLMKKSEIGTTRYDVELRPPDLRQPGRAQPYALARHFCAWILYHHPRSRGKHSINSLSKRYGRDRTCIRGGIKRAEGFIRQGIAHPYAVMLQDVCDALTPSYGPFDIWNHYGLRRPGVRQFREVA